MIGLRVTLGAGTVLRGVDLAIRPGEALGLVGESGSGKSMTARAIGRLLPRGARSEGTITFDGTDVAALDGKGLRELPRPGRHGLPGSRARTSTRCAGSATS